MASRTKFKMKVLRNLTGTLTEMIKKTSLRRLTDPSSSTKPKAKAQFPRKQSIPIMKTTSLLQLLL